MDVHAQLRHLRMSPRKVRLVIDAVRGLPATTAETRLQFMKQLAAQPVLKLLRSAMANATHNFHLSKEGLKIAKITADGGPTVKRFTQRAFGRGAPIRKRTSHVTIILSSPEAGSKAEHVPAKAEGKKAAPAKKPSVRAKKAPARSAKKEAAS